ncbi:MAG TPA: PKD domain-containing protein [Solirubrobacteraceae bacterium]|nr:PKD domain-containing protein [Solirubrobacteraceae bacterium]
MPSAAAAAGWLAGAPLSEGEANSNSQAVAPDGETIVAWTQKTGAETRVEIRDRQPGGSFGPATPVSPAGGNAESPEVAMDAHGNALLVWQRAGLAEYSSRPAGGSFEKAQVLSAEGEGVAGPHVAFASTGEAVVMWLGATGPFTSVTDRIETRARPAGASSFGPAQQLEAIGPYSRTEFLNGFSTAPLVHDAHGNVLAMIEREEAKLSKPESSQFEIHLFSRPAGGSFGAGTPIASASGPFFPPHEVVASPGVAMNPNGDAIVTWQRRTAPEENFKIEARLKPAGGTLGAPEVISTRKNSLEPQAALDAAGDATVAWVGEDQASKKQTVLEADRPAGGAFGPVQSVSDPSLETTAGPQSPTLAIGPGGETLIAWIRYQEPSRVEAAARPAGGTFAAQQPISPNGKSGTVETPWLQFDESGDAVASWRSFFVVEWAAHDVTGPLLNGLSIPAGAVVGVPVAFSVTPLDAFSALGASTWSFGDGGSATGPIVNHTFSRPGTFAVGLSSADALGNATAATGTITVTAPPVTPPKLEHVRQSHARWREGSALARLARKAKAPVGTVFSFTLDQAARVTLSFTQSGKGRRVKGRCVAATGRNRHARPCTRTLALGSLPFAAHAGANRISFQGRLSASRKLRPGTYTALIVATNAAGQRSSMSRLITTIVR